MRQDYYENSKDYINRWVISYADFVTMLLALFLVLYAMAVMENNPLEQAKTEIQQIFQKNNRQEQNDNEHQKIINELNKSLEQGDISQNALLISGSKGVTVRINNNTLFDEGSAIIKEDAMDTLDKIAQYLKKIDNKIVIEGHTDSTPISTGEFKSNWELSTMRATNVIRYLTQKHKINPIRLCAQGYGEYTPLETNETQKGREQNRRIDIVIINSQQD